MNFWEPLWKICFIGALAVFAVMSVWVTIAGWFDIWRMLARLRKETNDDEQSG